MNKITFESIVVCKCSGVKEKAETAFKIAYPATELPPLYKGKDAIISLADKHANTNLGNHLKAIARKNGQYAYYIESDEDDNISKLYDLLKGKEV